MSEYDVAIIGAGTAGLSALHEVRKQTENFIIINAGPYGTTCARVGCMPSKALIESANAFHRRNRFGELGIRGADGLAADVPAVLRRVRKLRDDFVAGAVELTDALGERSIAGQAAFVAPDTLQVGDRCIRAKSIIIATGSRPIVPRSWAALGKRLLTSDDLFEQERLPASMAVIGLGVVGTEMAQALARLGVHVTAVGESERIAGLTDPHVSKQAIALLRDEFTIHLGHRAEPEAMGERIRVHAGNETIEVDAVFAALGRRPNVEGLALQHLGVRLDEHGMPPVSPQSMQIADLPVYIAGDVRDDVPVLHEANDDGYIGGYNALRQPACFKRRTPLDIVFCDPNIAVTGKRFAELDGTRVNIGAVDFSRQGRARVSSENRGVLRVYASKETGRLLGAEMCAPRGEHLAHLLALAIEQRLTVYGLLRMPFYHPVFEEGLRSALRDLSRQLQFAPQSDLADCDSVGADALD